MLPAQKRFARTWDSITVTTLERAAVLPDSPGVRGFLFMAKSFTEYLGIIARTHGLDGSIVLSDTTGLKPSLTPGSTVGVGFTRDFSESMTVEACALHGDKIILRFRGITTPEAAEVLFEKAVYVLAEDVGVVEEQRFAVGEIEGCLAMDRQGALVGSVTEVWLLPANDVWVITTPDGSTIPLPVLDHTVLSVDLLERTIVVDVPDGLQDIDKPQPGEEHDA